jgi:ATP-binding cassette, subfamily B, bacterial
MKTIKRLNSIIEGNGLVFVISIIFLGLGVFFSMLVPLVIKFIVDVVLQGYQPVVPIFFTNNIEGISISYLQSNLWIFFIIIVFLGVFESIFSFVGGVSSTKVAEGIAKNLRDKLYLHMQKLPFSYYSSMDTGDLVQRSTSDIEEIRRFYDDEVVIFFESVYMIIFAFIILSSINLRLTLISFSMSPVLIMSTYFFFYKNNEMFDLVECKNSEKTTAFQENLTSVRVVRSFGNQKSETKDFEEKNKDYSSLNTKFFKNHAIFWSITEFICLLQIAIVLFYGTYMVYKGTLSIGSLTVFYTYINMFIWPIRDIGSSFGEAGSVKVSIDRVDEILNVKNEENEIKGNTTSLKGDIIFKNVYFEYIPNKPVLKNFNMTIKNGQTVGILGGTGVGKTTIVHLLLRLLDYKDGSITINGEEIVNIDKDWMRANIAVALQEPFLLSCDIKENLRMAKSDATDLEIIKATKIADIHQDIMELKEGYNTIVGEDGAMLSGGEKQRICLARTLLKISQILILDDSMSAVDIETDSNIREALKDKNKGITTIIISSRINTLIDADKIFVIEDGEVADEGTHLELINKVGLYSRIWDLQKSSKF